MAVMIGEAGKFAELEAVVYPVCKCGKPWVDHGDCGGYQPTRPTKNFGTVSFISPDLLANFYWKLELFFKILRNKRVQRCLSEQEQ